ncbi:asparagine synthase [Devosia sp. H5989]|uniref:asparagine synthase (glutamine-hydrolyzing) n=1 Tax=Paradevosia tibetensis TaxID=1447062 RepID=A0A5B9DI21_9HYPH|nr:asparagine synthase (glutamine-hydrolyzing) [Youhaiella tibetensis]AKR57780.1 asparagine synthase [Devosia sp. H5989]QEE18727.1 asparagine synthase (glutamine-hydrolyzing) [Youhaiella tibetensis]
MCGIAGFFDRRSASPDSMRQTLKAMTDRLVHRGPDDEGQWVDAESGIALGHRRLSIVDLSPAGHQPMVSASGRYVIVYNGEIYNFQDMRVELERKGATFRGHSDTEVVLAAIEEWGLAETARRLIGMFAFALWDRADRNLTLVRDQVGIKPLYWAQDDDVFLFGSELKALRAYPGWTPSIDRDSVAAYMRHGYVPAPFTIWRDTHKLLPGTMLVLRNGKDPETVRYWGLDNALEAANRNPFNGSDAEAIVALDDLLRDAVKRQMVADVSLGAFLSGGIDSSTVVALMQAQSDRPVRTFSIGFHEDGYDEAKHAKSVARHLGTDHTELYVTSADAQAVVPHLTEWYDEPFADSSQIPTYLVSRLARQHVTVSLSGDGGDESFGGYNRYFYATKIWQQTHRVPSWAMALAGNAIQTVPAKAWDVMGHLIPPSRRPSRFGHKMHKLAGTFLSDDGNGQDALYRGLISQWHEPDNLVPGAREHKGMLWDETVAERIPDFFNRMQYFDTLTYLPDDILTKVDRASMAVSLESRVPLLDHRVIEFALRLPMRMKYRNGQGKWLLQQVLKRYVPEEITNRPKMGFGVPIDHWLRNELSEWAGDLLSPQAIARHGLLDPEQVTSAWTTHLSGQANLQYPLWTVLMLQDWLDRQCMGQ